MTTTDSPTSSPTLAALADARPGAARVLERHGLDYCCGGQQSLDQACAERGLDPADVLAELATTPAEGPAPWADLGLTDLVDHIESTHHRYLHSELPRLTALARKVSEAHGDRLPHLREVEVTYDELCSGLSPHLMKEERVLFPMIRELDAASSSPTFHCGSLVNPIKMMLMEHDRDGELLARLHHLTDAYAVPEDACSSHRALLAGLAELEADTHLHMHKENNVLFPAVLALEAELATAG